MSEEPQPAPTAPAAAAPATNPPTIDEDSIKLLKDDELRSAFKLITAEAHRRGMAVQTQDG